MTGVYHSVWLLVDMGFLYRLALNGQLIYASQVVGITSVNHHDS
jgi:hypothetical protein